MARGWLWLGLLALIGSGLFSVLLVVSRTPGINQWLPVADFFRVALVVHVDLSVLVWFIAMAGLLWSLNSAPGAGRSGRIAGWAAPALCAAGALLMSLAPFVERAEPIMANYIPVLDGPVFLAGLVVFAVGVGVLVLRCLWLAPKLGPTLRRRRRAALRPQRQRGRHRGGAGRLRLVAGGGAHSAGRQGLLRDPVLGRRPCAAVHLDAADAGGLAVAGQRLRRARAR